MEPVQHPNGVIIGYRLYNKTKKMSDVVTVKDNSQEIIYRLQNLGLSSSISSESVLTCYCYYSPVHQVQHLGQGLHQQTRGRLLGHIGDTHRRVWAWQVLFV